jgi:hypothetical protein
MTTPETPSEGPGVEPPSWPDAAAPAEQPPSIRKAVRLMWAGAALSAIGIILTFLQTDEIKDAIRDEDSSLTAEEVDDALAFALTLTVVIGLIAIGLWLWMASANGKGKPWARTVATVFGGLNLLFFLLGLVQGQTTALGIVLGLISVALAAVILFFLYQEDSNRYYDLNSPR